jgi:hypothetical protein
VQKFKGTTRDGEDRATESGTRATAHLPGLDIEIMYWGVADGDAEQISINLGRSRRSRPSAARSN